METLDIIYKNNYHHQYNQKFLLNNHKNSCIEYLPLLKNNNKWYYENIRKCYNYIIFKNLNNIYNNNKNRDSGIIEEYNNLINNFCDYNNKEDLHLDAKIKNIIDINDLQKVVLYSTTDTYFISFQIKTIYDNLNYFKNFIQEFREDFDYSDEILNETIIELQKDYKNLNETIIELKDNNENLNNSIKELKKTNYIYSLYSIIFIIYNLFNYFF
jgi:hypothetical protein